MSGGWTQHGQLAVIVLAFALSAVPASAAERISLLRDDGKTVAARVYPVAPAACRGIAVISHGAGGSENGYAYLGTFMAAQGYLTVVPGNPESGPDVVRNAAIEARSLTRAVQALISYAPAYQARLMEIDAARRWAAARCIGQSSVLLGHSMGAATTLMAAGAQNRQDIQGSDRFDRYVALSAQGVGSIFPEHAWQNIGKPVLLMTGTRDEPVGGGDWHVRTQAYTDMRPGCKWLGVVEGATHLNFAGVGLKPDAENLILKTIAAFLNSPADKNCPLPDVLPGLNLQGK